MIGMGFGAFLTLFVISLIAAGVVHYGFRYRFLNGIDGFLAKWIVGWLGAWVGSPVLGHWFTGVAIGGQYIIPAFLGAFSTVFMIACVSKAVARMMATTGEVSHEMAKAPSTASVQGAPATKVA
jgi:uncharacterized membrane protein YeaQ/YmgE (transglycosylase-associated protein family)